MTKAIVNIHEYKLPFNNQFIREIKAPMQLAI